MLKTFQVFFLILFFFSRIAQAQDFIGHYAVGLQGGLNLPIGNSIITQKPEKMGAAYGFTFKYFPSDRFSMGFNLRSIQSGITTTSTYTVPTSHTIISLSAEHYFNSEGDLRPFIGLELGISVNNLDFPVPFKNQQLVPNPYSSFLGVPKAGVMYKLNNAWSIMGEADFHNLFDPGDTSFWKADDGTSFAPVKRFLTGTIGIMYHFGEMGLKPKGEGVHKHIHSH
jgi:hypothetical protein